MRHLVSLVALSLACAAPRQSLIVRREVALVVRSEPSGAQTAEADDRLPHAADRSFLDRWWREHHSATREDCRIHVNVRELYFAARDEHALFPRASDQPFARVVARAELEHTFDAYVESGHVHVGEWKSLRVAPGSTGGLTRVDPVAPGCGNDEIGNRIYETTDSLRRTCEVRAFELAPDGRLTLELHVSQIGRPGGNSMTSWERKAGETVPLRFEELTTTVALASDECLVLGNLRDVWHRNLLLCLSADLDEPLASLDDG